MGRAGDRRTQSRREPAASTTSSRSVRADGSGDTFVFTQFLTFSTPSWESDQGYGTTIAWPRCRARSARRAMTAWSRRCRPRPIPSAMSASASRAALAAAKLGTAMLKNEAGEFVLPTPETIVARRGLARRAHAAGRAADAWSSRRAPTPIRWSTTNTSSSRRSSRTRRSPRRCGGSCCGRSCRRRPTRAIWTSVHFVPLPPHIWELSQAQIQLIR